MNNVRSRISFICRGVMLALLIYPMMSGALSPLVGQSGSGRPSATPSKPKRTSPRRTKPATSRTRPNAPVSATSNSNKVSPDRSAGVNNNANANTRTISPRSGSPANQGNRDSGTEASVSSAAELDPNPSVVLVQCPQYGVIDVTHNSLSEISGKKKVFLNKPPERNGEEATLIFKKYSGLEITEYPPLADFVLNFCHWDSSKRVASGWDRKVRSGTTLLVTIHDPPARMPRVIWQDEAEDTYLEYLTPQDASSSTYASERLSKRFIVELKKARGEPDWDAPFLRDRAEILLPQDFRKRESENAPVWRPPQSSLPEILGQQADEPIKPLNTGSLADISNKRKVFVNFTGPIGDKMITTLGTYRGLEVVKTATEADLAVNLYYWEREERSPPQGLFGEQTVKDVTGATMIVTIRDPSRRIPRIVWQNDDTDGGWLKRGEAYDKLIKRFISDVKKMRGER